MATPINRLSTPLNHGFFPINEEERSASTVVPLAGQEDFFYQAPSVTPSLLERENINSSPLNLTLGELPALEVGEGGFYSFFLVSALFF